MLEYAPILFWVSLKQSSKKSVGHVSAKAGCQVALPTPWNRSATATATVLDGGGRTLMPGLIDAHTNGMARPTFEVADYQKMKQGVAMHSDRINAHQGRRRLRGY